MDLSILDTAYWCDPIRHIELASASTIVMIELTWSLGLVSIELDKLLNPLSSSVEAQISMIKLEFSLCLFADHLIELALVIYPRLAFVLDSQYVVFNGTEYAVLIFLNEYAVLDRKLDTPYPMEVDTPYRVIDQNSAHICRIFLDGYGVLVVRTVIFKYLCLSSRMRYLHGINDDIKVTLFDVIIRLIPVSINSKFLNCLQPEWIKHVTMVRHNQTGDTVSYDVLYDSVVQFEPHVLASKANKAAKNHDPLALLAQSNASSSQSHANSSYLPQLYYVTHPSSVKFSTPTNNRLHTSSNTRNQAVIQDGRVDIQTKNASFGGNGNKNAGRLIRNQAFNAGTGNDERNRLEQMFLAMKDEVGSNLNNEENDFMLDNSYGEEIMEELTVAVMLMAQIQPADGNAEIVLSYDAKAVSELNKKAFKDRENRYLEDIIDLEEKLSSHDRIVYKMGQLTQTIHMLGKKPNKVYDPFLKVGLCYKNPERLKKAIAAQPKMYDGEMLHSAKLKIDSPDSEETLVDAEESRLKMRNKMV
ncbi:hypothetical protein Tco_1059506 [Tanacetum coccineum]